MSRETEKPPLTTIDEKPTDGTSTSKKDQDGQGMMKSVKFSRVPNPDEELENYFLSRCHGVMIFVDKSFLDRFFFGFVHMQ